MRTVTIGEVTGGTVEFVDEDDVQLSSVDDLVPITDAYTFICDDFITDGVAQDGNLDNNRVFSGTTRVANNKGQSTIGDRVVNNSLRFKGAGQGFAFKLGVDATITVYGESHASRIFIAGTTDGGHDLAVGTVDTGTLTFDASSGQTVYLTSVNDDGVYATGGDLYCAGFTVTPKGASSTASAQYAVGSTVYLKAVPTTAGDTVTWDIDNVEVTPVANNENIYSFEMPDNDVTVNASFAAPAGEATAEPTAPATTEPTATPAPTATAPATAEPTATPVPTATAVAVASVALDDGEAQNYESFAAAVTAANGATESAVITLLGDAEITEQASFTKDVTIKAAEEGIVLSTNIIASSTPSILVASGASANVTLDGTDNTFTFAGNPESTYASTPIEASGGTITLRNITVKDIATNDRSAVCAKQNGALVIDGVTFENCTSQHASNACVIFNGRTLVLNGDITFTDCQATNVYTENNDVTADGGSSAAITICRKDAAAINDFIKNAEGGSLAAADFALVDSTGAVLNDYILQLNGSGNLDIIEAPQNVATVTIDTADSGSAQQSFTNFDDALAYARTAKSAATIELLDDVTINDRLAGENSKSITITANTPVTITSNVSGKVAFLAGGNTGEGVSSTLTFDGTADKNITFEGYNGTINSNLFEASSRGTLNLVNVKVTKFASSHNQGVASAKTSGKIRFENVDFDGITLTNADRRNVISAGSAIELAGNNTFTNISVGADQEGYYDIYVDTNSNIQAYNLTNTTPINLYYNATGEKSDIIRNSSGDEANLAEKFNLLTDGYVFAVDSGNGNLDVVVATPKIAGSITITGQSLNTGNKVDSYKLTANDLTVTLTPTAGGDPITATVTGNETDGTLAYTANVANNTVYTVSVSQDLTGINPAYGVNEYIVEEGSVTSAETGADTVTKNITAVKTYTMQYTVRLSQDAIDALNSAGIDTLYLRSNRTTNINNVSGNEYVLPTCSFEVADLVAGTDCYVYQNNIRAINTTGETDVYHKAILSTSEDRDTMIDGWTTSGANQDSVQDSEEQQPIMRIQRVEMTVAA